MTTAIRIFSLWFFPVRAFRKGQGLGWGGIDVGICVGVSVRVCVTAASSSRWFGIGGSVSGHSNFGEGWRGRSSLGWLHSPVFWGGGLAPPASLGRSGGAKPLRLNLFVAVFIGRFSFFGLPLPCWRSGTESSESSFFTFGANLPFRQNQSWSSSRFAKSG